MDGAGDVDGEGAVEGGRHRPGRVPLVSVPESLRSVDVAVGGRAVRGVLLVALVVLLVLGGRWWYAERAARPGVAVADRPDAVASVTTSPATGAGPSAVPGADPSGAAGADPPGAPGIGSTVLVHVVGQVHEPGVVRLPAGSRVVDAVTAAGGLTDRADAAALNLARPLQDGEQVWVGAPGEEPPAGHVPAGDGSGAGGGGPAGGGGVAGSPPGGSGDASTGSGVVAGPLDLNHADQAALEALPGVGPVMAGDILSWRQAHGGFRAVEELMEISGIGEKTFARLEPLVTVGP